jgi:hypothetical protein
MGRPHPSGTAGKKSHQGWHGQSRGDQNPNGALNTNQAGQDNSGPKDGADGRYNRDRSPVRPFPVGLVGDGKVEIDMSDVGHRIPPDPKIWTLGLWGSSVLGK